MNEIHGFKLGCIPDLRDPRDYTVKHPAVEKFLLLEEEQPEQYFLPLIAPIKNQGNIGWCTGCSTSGMGETLQFIATGFPADPLSHWFSYKIARNLMKLTGDTGAYNRTAMKAFAAFGIPPVEYAPCDPYKFDDEPTAFQYSYAERFRADIYYRLDPYGKDTQKVIDSLKLNLAANRPFNLGYAVFDNHGVKGDIPMPQPSSKLRGWHSVYACGWDDKRAIGSSIGGLYLAGSWGISVGYAGFFWLPYDYFRDGLAQDCWTAMKIDWFESGQFGVNGNGG